MEIDQNSENQPVVTQVTGQVLHFNKGAAFFRFTTEQNKDEVCLFRPNKLFLDGQKLGASNFKSVEAISQILRVGDSISGLVGAITEAKPYKIEALGTEITPGWYAQIVWRGERPKEADTIASVSDQENKEKEVFIDDVQGKIVHNKMAINGKGGANQTFIAFINPDGKEDLAMFRNPRYFYIDGERARADLIKHWPVGQELEVMFSGIYTPSLKEYVHIEGEGETMNVETRFKPNWRAKIVWMGQKPSEETVNRDNNDRQIVVKNKKDKTEFLETIKDCDYLCARLEKIVNNCQGILMLKSRGILFDIENLSIDGSTFSKEDNLNKHLEVGENLFAYVKNIQPKIVDGYEVSSEAAQIWKGKRNLISSEKMDKKKTPIPLPSEASHHQIRGTVVDVESPGLGYLVIKEPEAEAINGDKVLFSRNRLFVEGQKLRFKDSLSDHVSVGDQLLFNMVRADPEEAEGEYKWLAVLTWKGTKPDPEEVNEISKKVENYRAKILMFDDWLEGRGFTSGILQVMGGSSKIGERALFTRDQVYVFGARMSRADLAYVLKINDKVQLELEELDSVILRFGVEIKYKASLVWVGPPPKLDENCDDFPHYVGNVVMPFITKRGFSIEEFTSLIKGTMPAKAREETANFILAPGNNLNPSSSSASAMMTKRPSLVLPPNTIYGKVVELKKAESSGMTGTEHGIFQIENGPWEGEKAFFNRNCLFCWGHNCAKADLMYLIRDGDKFCVEVADGTNNKAVPFKVTSAWIGPHPHEKNKESAAMAGNPHFMKWCSGHGLTVDLFRQVIAGEAQTRLFFPLAGDQHQARVAYLFPQSSTKTGSDGGVLRLFAGHPNSKEGRKAPEVLFERESVYIWNVQISNGDLNYVLQENDKVFVEVVDLLGKDKKKWQNRLGSVQVPKFIATMVFVGGGRPKLEKMSEDFTKNSNLVQWLNKRNIDIDLFTKLIAGKVPIKTLDTGGEDMFSQDYPNIGGFSTNGSGTGMGSPFNNPSHTQRALGASGGHSWSGASSRDLGPRRQQSEFANPIMRQAEQLIQRTMMLQSPEDPEVTNLIQDDSEAQLALFLSKTMTNAIMMYRSGGGSSATGPIGPPAPGHKPGPIGPPGRGKGGSGRGGGRGSDISEFYADSSMSGRGGGLYGLSEPLLQYQGPGGQTQAPAFGIGGPGSMEPPYKRKYEDW